MKTCPNCRLSLADSAPECVQCHYRFAPPPMGAPAPPPQVTPPPGMNPASQGLLTQSVHVPNFVWGIVVACALIFAAVMRATDSPKRESKPSASSFNPATPVATNSEPAQEDAPVDVTIEQIWDTWANNPVKAKDVMDGKRLRFTAPIDSFNNSMFGDRPWLTFSIPTSNPYISHEISVSFPERMRDAIGKLQRGDRVTVEVMFMDSGFDELKFFGRSLNGVDAGL